MEEDIDDIVTAEDEVIYARCVQFVVEGRKASPSLLERKFHIGYARAAWILDRMETEGIISAPQGAMRHREVLVDKAKPD